MEVVKNLLIKKFNEIHRRIILVLNQLNDQEVNWRPNEYSNSISNLIIHINGNIDERIRGGIKKEEFIRDREREFDEVILTKHELVEITNDCFGEVIETINEINDNNLLETQIVRNTERTNLDMLFQCSSHFSEHLGQILYIAKILKGLDYVTTSIPRK